MQNNAKSNVANTSDLKQKSNIQNLKFFNSYQNKIFKDIYDFESDIDLSRYYIKKENDSIKITEKSKVIEIIDSINEILSKGKITDEEAKIIVQLMKQKGWTNLNKVNFNESNKEFIKKIEDNFENKK